uniref:Cellular repressor of E1A-stimulated genes 2 n=1 Tax=Salmo trutta TaxID=8032 RepID=A0A673X8I2_SALTR
ISKLFWLFKDDAMPVPPHQETARTARYMPVYNNILCPQIKGLPFGNIFSTGVLYFYVTLMDCSLLRVCLCYGSTLLCLPRQQMYDPEDPRCDRLTLTGKMVEVEFAKEAMFSRHPVMKKWPVGHNWFLMKLQLTQVWLQDWVGGVSLIPLEDYFKATPY